MILILALACTAPTEGDDAEECRDGADNDQNGWFDCADQGCWGSPDCPADTAPTDTDTDTDADTDADTDTDTDTDTDSDTDTDTDTDTDVPTTPAHLLTYEVEFTVDWLFTSSLPNCRIEYVGSGDQYETVDARVTFDGPYARTKNTCDASMNSVIPWAPTDGDAKVSFEFNADLTELLDWFADDTETERYVRADWYMYDMYAVYDDTVQAAHYSETYNDPSGEFSVVYVVDVVFN